MKKLSVAGSQVTYFIFELGKVVWFGWVSVEIAMVLLTYFLFGVKNTHHDGQKSVSLIHYAPYSSSSYVWFVAITIIILIFASKAIRRARGLPQECSCRCCCEYYCCSLCKMCEVANERN